MPRIYQNVEPKKIHKCDKCFKIFRHQGHLTVHLRVHSGEKPFQCEKCDKSFSQSSTLELHRSTHFAKKPYKCKVCQRKFSCSGYLKKHLRNVHGKDDVRLKECPGCNQSYSAVYLKSHFRVHTCEKPYVCTECNKSFGTAWGRSVHERIHSKVTNFRCGMCAKGFNTQSHLYRHIRSHLGEKPERCELCGVRYATRAGLMEHLRSHQETNQRLQHWSCVFCDYQAVTYSRLERHLTKHTRETPEFCRMCGQEFSTVYQRNLHQRNKHKTSLNEI